MTLWSNAFFVASLLRRRKWVCWIRRTPPNGKIVGTMPSVEADSVQRILVRVEGDHPLWVVRLRSLPPDHEYDLAWDDGERTQRPR